ncbi:hypothetical protein TNCV_58251 [Trichonephila clavipes]|nr:hypothetical protein TNCV_58251 [Trichonephila clavipes]
MRAMNRVILSLGQVMRVTTQLKSLSKLSHHANGRTSAQRISSGTRLELATHRPRVHDHNPVILNPCAVAVVA